MFAVVTPIDGGYLSVRLKPTSDLFPEVQKARRRSRGDGAGDPDHAGGERRQASCRPRRNGLPRLLRVFFDGIGPRFLGARSKSLGRAADGVTSTLHAVSDFTSNVLARATAIQDAYGDAKHAPMNFSLEAARAGSAGAATGVVAANYHILAKELNANLLV